MSLFFLEKFIVQMQITDVVILYCAFDCFLSFMHAVVTNYLQSTLNSYFKYYSIAKGVFFCCFLSESEPHEQTCVIMLHVHICAF